MPDLEAAAADNPQRDTGREARDPVARRAGQTEGICRVGDLLDVLAVDNRRRGLGEEALGEALLARAVVAGGPEV